MKPLTPKQEKFAQCVSSGMTQADAYRKSFNVKTTTKPETVISNSSQLMANTHIAQRVSDLREQLSNKALWTREESVQALKNVLVDGKGTEVVSAVKELNSMHGYNAPIKIDADIKATVNIYVPELSEYE